MQEVSTSDSRSRKSATCNLIFVPVMPARPQRAVLRLCCSCSRRSCSTAVCYNKLGVLHCLVHTVCNRLQLGSAHLHRHLVFAHGCGHILQQLGDPAGCRPWPCTSTARMAVTCPSCCCRPTSHEHTGHAAPDTRDGSQHAGWGQAVCTAVILGSRVARPTWSAASSSHLDPAKLLHEQRHRDSQHIGLAITLAKAFA